MIWLDLSLLLIFYDLFSVWLLVLFKIFLCSPFLPSFGLCDYFFSYLILIYWWLFGLISMCNYSLVVFKFFPYLWFLALITMCLLNLTCLHFPDFSNLKIYDIHQIFGHFFPQDSFFDPTSFPLLWDSSSTYVRPFKVVSQVLTPFFPELLCCSNLMISCFVLFFFSRSLTLFLIICFAV